MKQVNILWHLIFDFHQMKFAPSHRKIGISFRGQFDVKKQRHRSTLHGFELNRATVRAAHAAAASGVFAFKNSHDHELALTTT
jgi:hypothetical protein